MRCKNIIDWEYILLIFMLHTARRLIIPLLLGIILIMFLIFWFAKWNSEWDISFSTGSISHQNYESMVQHGHDMAHQDIATYNEAISRWNIDLCQHIVDLVRREECNDQIILAHVQAWNTQHHCDEIQHHERKKHCEDFIIQESAINALDKSQCAAIWDERMRKRCREDIDGAMLQNILKENRANPTICQSLEWSFRIDCLRSMQTYRAEEQYLEAIKSGVIANCDQIWESKLATTCRDTLLLEHAQNNRNHQLCGQIIDTEKQQFCHERTQIGIDIDILQQATSTNNLNQCQQIGDERLKNQCNDGIILTLVRTSKNAALCQALTNTGLIADCHRIQSP